MKNKTIDINSQKMTIKFKNVHIKRVVDENDYKTNTHSFIINGYSFPVSSESKRSKKSGKMNTIYIYNGVCLPDNEKQIIEYIYKTNFKLLSNEN